MYLAQLCLVFLGLIMVLMWIATACLHASNQRLARRADAYGEMVKASIAASLAEQEARNLAERQAHKAKMAAYFARLDAISTETARRIADAEARYL